MLLAGVGMGLEPPVYSIITCFGGILTSSDCPLDIWIFYHFESCRSEYSLEETEMIKIWKPLWNFNSHFANLSIYLQFVTVTNSFSTHLRDSRLEKSFATDRRPTPSRKGSQAAGAESILVRQKFFAVSLCLSECKMWWSLTKHGNVDPCKLQVKP